MRAAAMAAFPISRYFCRRSKNASTEFRCENRKACPKSLISCSENPHRDKVCPICSAVGSTVSRMITSTRSRPMGKPKGLLAPAPKTNTVGIEIIHRLLPNLAPLLQAVDEKQKRRATRPAALWLTEIPYAVNGRSSGRWSRRRMPPLPGTPAGHAASAAN